MGRQDITSNVEGNPLRDESASGVLQGTLDLLILRVLKREPVHGWGIADRIKQHSQQALSIGEGSLYPALYRLEARGWVTSEWGLSENHRRARFYRLTRKGRRQLEEKTRGWHRLVEVVARALESEP